MLEEVKEGTKLTAGTRLHVKRGDKEDGTSEEENVNGSREEAGLGGQ